MKKVKYKRDILENKLWNDEMRILILNAHGLNLVSEKRNVILTNKMETETDVVLIGETKERKLKRKVGIELKEHDFAKAISQAVRRRKYFNYFYVILGMSAGDILNQILNDYNIYEAIRVKGIGLISFEDKQILHYSHFFSTPLMIEDFTEIKT